MKKNTMRIEHAKNVREWYSFYGGEEMEVSLETASIIWDAALKSVEIQERCRCGTTAKFVLCKKCYSDFLDCLE